MMKAGWALVTSNGRNPRVCLAGRRSQIHLVTEGAVPLKMNGAGVFPA